MWHDLALLAPIWVTCVAAFVVLLLTVAGGYERPAAVGGHLAFVALAGLAIAGWLLLQHEGDSTAFSGAIQVDGLSTSFGFIAVAGAFISILLATAYLHEHGMSQGEFLALVLLGTAGMLMVSMAGDLMTLFIGIETMSLAVYVLAGFRRASRRAQEAAMKYFVYGAFASAFVVFGIALLYGEMGRLTGTPAITFTAIAQGFAAGSVSGLGWVGVALVFGGLAFKVAAVPFHMWAPDVYEGAPTPSTGFMAVGIKAAAFAGICRFASATLLGRGEATDMFIQAIEVLAMLTMLVGNFLAIRQTQIKRMLAYSSIAHAGYALVGVAAFVAQPETKTLEAIGYYLFGYTAMTLGAFGVIIAFERNSDRRADMAIERLAGAAYKYPALGLAMALFMFALAGVPPTTGFFAKLSIFSAAVAAGRIPVVIVAVVSSAVGAYYYLRILVVMYMRATSSSEHRVRSTWLAAGLWACAAITLAAGIVPDVYLTFARRALQGWLG